MFPKKRWFRSRKNKPCDAFFGFLLTSWSRVYYWEFGPLHPWVYSGGQKREFASMKIETYREANRNALCGPTSSRNETKRAQVFEHGYHVVSTSQSPSSWASTLHHVQAVNHNITQADHTGKRNNNCNWHWTVQKENYLQEKSVLV